MTEVKVIWGVILFLMFLGHSLEVTLVLGFGDVVVFIVELLIAVVVVAAVVVVVIVLVLGNLNSVVVVVVASLVFENLNIVVGLCVVVVIVLVLNRDLRMSEYKERQIVFGFLDRQGGYLRPR